ncbi:MAG: hypothetical protein ACPG47_00160 [Leucothrix sp.]
MTDENLGGEDVSHVDTSEPVVDNAPVSAPTPTTYEPTLAQSEVNKLVGSAKQKGYQKGYEKALNEYQSQQPETASIPQASPQAVTSQEEIQKLVDERLAESARLQKETQERTYYESEATRVLNELAAKTNEVKANYSDFDDKLAQVGYFEKTPELLHYANTVDNSGDVLYDLAANPAKMATFKQLSDINPQLAVIEMKRLSDSIKQNKQAQSQKMPPDPLRPVKSSNVGTDNGDTSSYSVGDWKKILRG